jgi:hypothetical protein
MKEHCDRGGALILHVSEQWAELLKEFLIFKREKVSVGEG